ncbi:hypothetical protein AT6N2_C3301 [Agrobacterium tumefaciens]|nr:hypothetical protein AT6N2_C3301 [Agrobacterium tumefaciens]
MSAKLISTFQMRMLPSGYRIFEACVSVPARHVLKVCFSSPASVSGAGWMVWVAE